MMTHAAEARLLNSWGAAAARLAGVPVLLSLGLPSESSPSLAISSSECKEPPSSSFPSLPSSAFSAAKPVPEVDFFRLL